MAGSEADVSNVKTDVDGVKTVLQEHEGKIVEAIVSARSAHHRIDEIVAGKNAAPQATQSELHN